jgi:endonuclease YncB( thermonuclease family)
MRRSQNLGANVNSVIAANVALLWLWFASSSVAAEPFTGKVVSVHDGDTVRVLDAANVQHKVRLDGI